MKQSHDMHQKDNKQDSINTIIHIYDNIIIDNPLLLEQSDTSYKCIFGDIPQNGNEDHIKKKIRTKSFNCEVNGCGKIYRSKENLSLHIKNIHLNLKPYRCRFCSSTFTHRNGIYWFKLGKTYHERKLHINYLPYKCNFDGIMFFYIDCNLAFASKSALCAHVNSVHLLIRRKRKKKAKDTMSNWQIILIY
jgi:uncharacterized C2H2 Zn-finger protein